MSTDPSLRSEEPSGSRPLLVLLHCLGGSARSWEAVTPALAARFDCRPLDLPGFGGADPAAGFTLDQMADAVTRVVRAAAPRRWVIVGHSMGAKVAAVLARRAEDGEPGLSGLSHLVLLAGSPPSPEPMDDSRRTAMMGWFTGDRDARRVEAQHFIDANVDSPLPSALNERAVDDVVRMDRAAWLAWLDRGSREDWADRVGVLQVPTLIVSGERDGDLGPEAQARLMTRHLAAARWVTIAGARHLLPMERPGDVARLVIEHLGSGQTEAEIPPVYRALIDTDRVSARTRSVLLERGQSRDPADGPKAMTAAAFAVLQAVVHRVLPQSGRHPIDLAARIDEALATGSGDGWRFALLPPDREAYEAALRTLDKGARDAFGQGYPALDPEPQERLLQIMAEGGLDVAPDGEGLAILPALPMKLWFEDLRAAAVQAYVAHPATLARIGYSGIANGGDGERKQGFVAVGEGQREAWEPRPVPAS